MNDREWYWMRTALILLAISINLWIIWRHRPKPQHVPRELVQVSYALADKMLRDDEGWRIAPEEDDNGLLGFVWLERDSPAGPA